MAADWIQDLCREKGTSHKEKVLERALIASRLGSASAECFLYNTYLAYNPHFYYGIYKVVKTKNITHRPNPWYKFWGILEYLRTGGFSQPRLDLITKVSDEFDSIQWNWVCRRVLLKDFCCGINVNTINKVLGNTEWRIPE